MSAAPASSAGVTKPIQVSKVVAKRRKRDRQGDASFTSNPYLPFFFLSSRSAFEQILRQRPIERHACIERYVVNATLETLAAVCLSECFVFLQVIAPITVCVDLESRPRLGFL